MDLPLLCSGSPGAKAKAPPSSSMQSHKDEARSRLVKLSSMNSTHKAPGCEHATLSVIGGCSLYPIVS